MPARLPNSIKSWFIVGVTGAALITAGAATAAGGPGGGGGGGGAKVPVGVVAAPPAATGGGAGAVNALMSPTVPLTRRMNSNPSILGMIRSVRTRSGWTCVSSSSACAPSSAAATSKPASTSHQ